MKTIKVFSGMIILLLVSGMFSSLPAQSDTASEETVLGPETVKNTFESGIAINNQTVEALYANSLDFTIFHRFGSIVDNNDKPDVPNLLGILGSSNIGLSVNYGIIDRLTIGASVTKYKHIYDVHWKYRALRQNTAKMPLSVTYFGNAAIGTYPEGDFINQDSIYKFANRLTFFHELMVARKINSHLSLQVSATYSHINLADTASFNGLKHEGLGASFTGRYKFSPQSSVVLTYWHPINTWENNLPKPDLGIGIEMSTGNHQFQLFIATADAILYQETRMFNQNDFLKKQMVIGFNISRQWGFSE